LDWQQVNAVRARLVYRVPGDGLRLAHRGRGTRRSSTGRIRRKDGNGNKFNHRKRRQIGCYISIHASYAADTELATAPRLASPRRVAVTLGWAINYESN